MRINGPPRTTSSTTAKTAEIYRANKAKRPNNPLTCTGSGGGRGGIAISGEHGAAATSN